MMQTHDSSGKSECDVTQLGVQLNRKRVPWKRRSTCMSIKNIFFFRIPIDGSLKNAIGLNTLTLNSPPCCKAHVQWREFAATPEKMVHVVSRQFATLYYFAFIRPVEVPEGERQLTFWGLVGGREKKNLGVLCYDVAKKKKQLLCDDNICFTSVQM